MSRATRKNSRVGAVDVVSSGGGTKGDGQNPLRLRRPTLVIDKTFPNARHDHQILWVDETAKVAYAMGQDRGLRKSSWTAANDQAGAFGARRSTSPDTSSWAANGVFLRESVTSALLMSQQDLGVGTNTVLLRSTNDGSTWTTVWTAPTNVVFLGPQSIAQDPVTKYLYLVEYTVDVSVTHVDIYRSTDNGATWAVFKSYPRADSGAGSIRHWHGVRWDPVSQRMHFAAGDNNADAGIYRVNGAGTDIEPVITNAMIGTLPGGIVSPARCVDMMFFADYIAWPCDGSGGANHVYRMARTEIGQASPVVSQVAEINSTGWWTQSAAADGSVWICSSSTEPTAAANDAGICHLYAVSNNGAQVDEVGAVVLDGNVLGFASMSGLAGGGGGGDAFWLRAHNYQQYPNVTYSAFQCRARLAWGVNAGIFKPADVRLPEYLREGRNWVGALTASQSVTFGHTKAPLRTKRLNVLNMGTRVTAGTGAAKMQIYNVTTSTVLLDYAGGLNWRWDSRADTQEYYDAIPCNAGDVIEFRSIETSGTGTPTVSTFVEFGWTF